METIKDFIEWLNLNYENEATRIIYLKNVTLYFKEYEVFNQENINAYFTSLNVASSTHAQKVASLKIYQRFYINHTQERIDIKFPRARKQRISDPKFITESQLEEIIEKIPIVFQEYDKARAVLSLMFYTGMRPKEIVQLKRENINIEDCLIELKDTKTGLDRIVPYPASMKESISSYFHRTNEVSNAFNITDRYLQYICIKVKENFNLKYFSPYVLRHSFAKCYLKKTNNNWSGLQKLMGHQDIKTTHLYTKNSTDEAIESYRSVFDKKGK